METLRSHGLLLAASGSEPQQLLYQVRDSTAFDSQSRQDWTLFLTEMVKQNRFMERSPNAPSLDTVMHREDIQRLSATAPKTEVAVLCEGLLRRLYPDFDGVVRPESGRTLAVCPASIVQAQPVKEAMALAHQGLLLKGASRDSYWTDVLEPLARAATNINILDKYLFAKGGRRPDGLLWFLDKLHQSSGKDMNVHLHFDLGVDNFISSSSQVLSLLKSWWRPGVGRIREIKTYGVSDPYSTFKYPHDRHIRFTSSQAIKIHAGIDRLDGPVVGDPDGMAWTYLSSISQVRALSESERRCYPKVCPEVWTL